MRSMGAQCARVLPMQLPGQRRSCALAGSEGPCSVMLKLRRGGFLVEGVNCAGQEPRVPAPHKLAKLTMGRGRNLWNRVRRIPTLCHDVRWSV